MARGTTLPRYVLLSCALVAGVAACGNDEESSSTTAAAASAGSTAGETEESYAIVSDAQVAEGLAKTVATLTSLASSPSTATDDAVTEVFEEWESYEGTIKDNDENAYLALEDALGLFKRAAAAGDQAGMQSALTDFSTASSEYLTAHPG